MKRLCFLLLTVVISLQSYSQGAILIQPEDVIAEAENQFHLAMQPEGSIKTWALEKGITGSYEYEITIGKKARIVSVRVLSSNNGTILHQNAVKDFLIDQFRFEMKIPKDKRYKLNYTFSF
jgi:hypothetical protein